MSLGAKIREQIINSFRIELSEHVQTMNDGLLALEQRKVAGEARRETLASVLRAAHSLKGAARAVEVSAIEQLAHSLEDVLGIMQQEQIAETPDLFTACYQAIDAIQAVQAAYEAGEITPPQASLKALVGLETIRKKMAEDKTAPPAPAEAPKLKRKVSQSAVKKLDELMAQVKDELGKDLVVEGVETVESPVQEVVQPAQPGPVGDETIRVSVGKLDSLMAQLSELLVTKIHAEQRLAEVHQAQEFTSLWQKEWLGVRSVYSWIARQNYSAGDDAWMNRLHKEIERLLEYVDSNQNHLREMSILINNLSREYQSDTLQMSLVIDGLEEEIKRVRMLPLNTITGSFGRMVRDLAQASGKEVVFEILGGEVELDKRVLEMIKDPIIHLLRNAVDHGIESSKARIAAGKPSYGSITLTAEQLGNDVSISVSDDGAGLDIASIRQVALRKGIASSSTMTDGELVDLIYNPGFSTSTIITDVSGRGVGLDVVHRNVENLRGRIAVDWTAGAGSRFTLSLPLTLTSSRGLLVRVSQQLFAIPLNAIERIEYIRLEDVAQVGGHDTLQYDGRPLTLAHLGDLLELHRTDDYRESKQVPVVILSAAERRMAIAVDEMADEQEVVIKGLGKQLNRVGGIAGATVMGNGEVILILNIADLIKLALRGEKSSIRQGQLNPEDGLPAAERPRQHILVVDDSITTRTLEKNILEAAGFTVELAMDGQEAYNRVATGELPNLIISDVSMPRLDGFGLARRIKGDSRTAKVPFILVTSLDSTEDKARGIESGADAYIVKSSFDQNNLLETIQMLI